MCSLVHSTHKGLIIVFCLAFFAIFVLLRQGLGNEIEKLGVKKSNSNIEITEAWESDKQSFQMEHCDCQKTINSSQWESEGITYAETTCGKDAYRRGKGQKVVAFSFYGDVNSDLSRSKLYFEGIKGNFDLMQKYYPGWIMRVYFDLDPNHPVLKDLCHLACSNDQLDICHAGILPGTPMEDARKIFAADWRFFPTLDPQVTTLVSRDLDSRFSHREFAAVSEWLNSPFAFHFMRDHPEHGTTILAGLWGVKLDDPQVRGNWTKTWLKAKQDPILWESRSSKVPDQWFLNNYIWPFANPNSVGHDSYFCQGYINTKGFPTKRLVEPNNFVGAEILRNDTLLVKCPEMCRPKDHQDWEYC